MQFIHSSGYAFSLTCWAVRVQRLTFDVPRGEHRGLEVLRQLVCWHAPRLMRVPLQLASPIWDLRQQLVRARVVVVAPRPCVAVVVGPATSRIPLLARAVSTYHVLRGHLCKPHFRDTKVGVAARGPHSHAAAHSRADDFMFCPPGVMIFPSLLKRPFGGWQAP